MTKNKCHRQLIILGLFWAFSITVMRAIRWPNDWAEAHWLINYTFGFIKRALPGTLLAPFIHANEASEHTELLIRVTASIIFLILCAVLFWLCLRIVKNNRFEINSVFTIFVFLTSPYIVMSAHLIGYYDNINAILTILACLLILRGHKWASIIVTSLAMLVHEAFLLIGYPSVIFLAFLLSTRAADGSSIKNVLATFISRYFPLVIIPLLAFFCIILNQSVFLDSAMQKERLFKYLANYEFVQFNRSDLVSTALTVSFFDYLKEESSLFFYRLTRPVYVIHTTLPLLVLLSYSWHVLRDVVFNKLIFLMLLLITLLPLAFHLVACDTSRIWTYPLFTAILAVYGMSEIFPDPPTKRSISLLFCINAIIVIVFHLFILTPLLDGECERFSNVLRVLFYSPSLVLVTTQVGRSYIVSRRSNCL